tara:strand:- start:302 stop:1438 length:1137 start_codon:yes stop_codon:yes gene_type:complete
MKRLLIVSGLLASFSSISDTNLNGFATMASGTVISGNDLIEGYDKSLSFEPNSLLGIQLSSNFSEKNSAVIQVITRGDESWDIDVDWAYISHKYNDEITFNAGRQRIPFFYYSEYIDVGYALPWITPPTAVYGIMTDTYTGVSGRYQTTKMNYTHSVDVIFGGNKERITLSDGTEMDVELKKVSGVSWSVNRDELTARGSYYQAKGVVDNSPFLDVLYSAWDGTSFTTITDEVTLDGDTVSFAGVALNYDGFENVFATEYTVVDYGNSMVQDEDRSFYAMLGHRFGNLLVHATFGAKRSSISYPDTSFIEGSHPSIDELIGLTNASIELFESDSRFKQIGIRYDTDSGIAMKAEYRINDNQLTREKTEMIQASMSVIF